MGVKSLWTLLAPVGRPVMLETMEGKIVAIDSSIWIYQFQATMRAKDGRALVNAHVLGFLRRICKLLFYGMKPVFVFDGGAPSLKRETLNERRKKKSGAAASHIKIAERLLAAQLRREALKHVQKSPSKGKGKAFDGPVELNEDTVYLEDIDPNIPTTPHKKEKKAKEPTSSGKKKFYDHDPYRLPAIDMEERVAKATRSSAPDPRLATEEELRSFIENMRPEDFDVTSAAFRELPTEVQYEIVGDLRLKSRQTSYTRLQQMLRSAPTPLDFSKQQIKNLKQRNSLTQQLLTTTDTIGKAHIEIPVRIASERNRQYLLMRNEGPVGGWILGVRDEGTKQKPIIIDHDEQPRKDDDQDAGGDSEDDEMEEVDIPTEMDVDPDLRNFHRQSALSGIARRYSPKRLAPLSTKVAQKPPQIPLFDLDEDDQAQGMQEEYWEEDEELAFAVQESLEYSSQANSSSRKDPSSSSHSVFGSNVEVAAHESSTSGARSRLETALSIANAGPSRISGRVSSGSSTSFGQPFLLTTSKPILVSSPEHVRSKVEAVSSTSSERPPISTPSPKPRHPHTSENISSIPASKKPPSSPAQPASLVLQPDSSFSPKPEIDNDTTKQSINTLEENSLPKENSPPKSPNLLGVRPDIGTMPETVPSVPLFDALGDNEVTCEVTEKISSSDPAFPSELLLLSDEDDDMEEISMPSIQADTEKPLESLDLDLDAAEPVSEGTPQSAVPLPRSPSPEEPISEAHEKDQEEHWDAAHEMNPDVEEGDFAQFVSQVKGRDIDDVRREIDAEIASLDQQRKHAMRDAEDVNQQMVNQIMMMLRLFGIPYITAPMEAEAQCAELLALNLVDGIITDDSDVFLFGGQRVFKNMFNQSKTVECFLSSDLTREFGLDQGTLIRLAYLLGSDYVEGLPGVGPVVAMELLKEFPGDDGLHKFKDWWSQVQSGRDRDTDNISSFRKRFKKKFKNLYLPSEWPNPAVRDAYYHPTVDDSDEPFKWGLPDLDALRVFLHDELGWGQSKVDDLLLPIIQKMGKRGQTNTVNRQGNLNNFLDISAGSGTAAPRKRQAYSSKRLQQVVSDFRKKRKSAVSEPSSADDENFENDAVPPVKKKPRAARKGKGKGSASASESTAAGSKKTIRGRRKPRAKKQESSDENDKNEDAPAEQAAPLAVNLRPRPKPKPIHLTQTTNSSIEDNDSDLV
ncbi:hypothetical protein GYMLUDRAFT_95656 [Collybiopsis luxurians FD-317 M1]|uniref:DNA repair protein rad13 n=1 Tax=Collybiopsis luxurians FD-317 M1 TaxID=944289 RepID=A0A0D0D1K0_9AGAR|nr:hypothetical protein GYMLUDRAFT_95656 [Collybiopsis luxurians FD-317 M1]